MEETRAAAGVWTPVLKRHPEGVAALDGYVWLDTPLKPLHVMVRELEFRDTPPE